MGVDKARLNVLQQLDDGSIDVDEALRRLDEPPVPAASAPRRSHSWWLIPLAVGMAFLGGGGLLASLGGAWWIPAVPLLGIGIGVTVLAAGSSDSPWIFIRVRPAGTRPRRVWVPIPVRAAAWMIEIARPWVPSLGATAVDDVLLTLERELGSDRDLVIDVDETGGGERVRVSYE
jgi:hypothetical protein